MTVCRDTTENKVISVDQNGQSLVSVFFAGEGAAVQAQGCEELPDWSSTEGFREEKALQTSLQETDFSLSVIYGGFN